MNIRCACVYSIASGVWHTHTNHRERKGNEWATLNNFSQSHWLLLARPVLSLPPLYPQIVRSFHLLVLSPLSDARPPLCRLPCRLSITSYISSVHITSVVSFTTPCNIYQLYKTTINYQMYQINNSL